MSRMRKGGLKPAPQKVAKKSKRRFEWVKSGKSFHLRRRADKPVLVPLISATQLIKETFKLLKENWKVFVGIGLLYAFFYRLFIEGITRLDFSALQETIRGGAAIQDKLIETATLSTAAFNSATTTVDTGDSFYAGFLTILFGLCVVWAARQLMAGREVRIRDALYNGPGPLLPVLIVVFVIFLQAIPVSFGIFIYMAGTGSGIVQGGVEGMVFFLAVALSAVLSFWWLSSSLIALMLATLPGMYPFVALHEAKELVTYRRWHLFYRVAVFAIVMALIWLAVVIISVSNPITLPLAAEVLGILRAFTVVTSVVFLYKLYRSLVAVSVEDA